jgi:hypothetical protein
MSRTCEHVAHMTKMIQIRHVPDDLHARLKARAALAGLSLSEYLLSELRGLAARPTLDEWLARVRAQPHSRLRSSPTAIIRALRGKT